MYFFKTRTELAEWLNDSRFYGKLFSFRPEGGEILEGELSFENQELIDFIFMWKQRQMQNAFSDPPAVLEIDGYERQVEFDSLNQQLIINEY